MFGSLGIGEILLIAAVALVILGPEKFPSHAKIAMRFIRDIRSYWDEAKHDLTEELKPVKKEIRELERFKPEDYLEHMADDRSEDTNYDGQGYPYSNDIAGEKPSDSNTANATETPADETGATASESWKQENETPSEDAGVQGTKPYSPNDDYVPEPEKYQD